MQRFASLALWLTAAVWALSGAVAWAENRDFLVQGADAVAATTTAAADEPLPAAAADATAASAAAGGAGEEIIEAGAPLSADPEPGPAASAVADDGVEAIVEWVLAPLFQEWIEAPMLGGEPALPLSLVMERLGIVASPPQPGDDPTWRRGWWGDRTRPFVVEGADAVEVAGVRTALGPARAQVRWGELWLTPGALKEAFGLSIVWDPGRLQIRSFPDPALPVWREWRRAVAMRQRGEAATQADLPIVGPRPRLLAGHVVDWELGFGDVVDPAAWVYGSWMVGWGAEVGRGMLTLAPAGTFAEPPDAARTRAVWSRPFDHQWLEEVEVGTVSAGSVSRRGVWGARVTNRPVWRPDGYATERRWVTAQPGALVDVYLDGDLIAWGEADDDGRLQVDLPLRYGTNRLRVESPDRWGGLRGDEALMRVTRGMLPPGAVEYAVDGGVDRLQHDLGLLAATAEWGVHRRLSLQAGVDGVLGDARHDPGAFPGLRLLGAPADDWLAGLGWNAAEGFVADVSWLHPRGFGASLVHRERRRHAVLSPGFETRRTSAVAAFPLEDLGVPLGLVARSEHGAWPTGARQDRMSGALTWRAGVWNGIVEYSWVGDLVAATLVEDWVTFGLSRPLPEWGPPRLPGGVVRGSTRVDPRSPALRSVEAGWIRSLPWLQRTQIDVAGGANWPAADRAVVYARAGLQVVVDGARMATQGYLSNGRGTLSAQAGGSVVFADGDDDGRPEVYPWWEPQLGRGQALVHVDAPDPDIVRFVEIDRRRWPLDERGVAFAPTLVRGRPVVAALRGADLRDPTLQPEPAEAVLAVRGHRVTVHRIELVATSELEGEVALLTPDGQRRPQGGVPMLLKDASGATVRRTRSFSDGLMYMEGVSPGRYVLAPDPTTLLELGWRSVPAAREIEIPEAAEGQLIGGMDFELSAGGRP